MKANGNSTGLKNMSSETSLETWTEDAEGWWWYLLPHVPAKQAEAIKLQLQLSSFYSRLGALWVSVFRRWFYPHTLLLRLGSPVHRKGRRREEKGEPAPLRVTRKRREKKKEEKQ